MIEIDRYTSMTSFLCTETEMLLIQNKEVWKKYKQT